MAVPLLQTIGPYGTGEDAWIEETVELRLWDENAALGFLGKHHKLAPDTLDINARVVEPSESELRKLDDVELRAAEIAELERIIAQAQRKLAELKAWRLRSSRLKLPDDFLAALTVLVKHSPPTRRAKAGKSNQKGATSWPGNGSLSLVEISPVGQRELS